MMDRKRMPASEIPHLARGKPWLTTLVLGVVVVFSAAAKAADWYVAPEGNSYGRGTKDAPWDVASALDGTKRIAPGDTVWVRQGTYKRAAREGDAPYSVRLAGRADAPVYVRGYPGEHVVIDGGLFIEGPATHLWIRDLEILVSTPRPEKPVPPDPTFRNVNRPTGGLNIYTGTGCKFINLVIHDNNGGVAWWVGSVDSEIYGCLIYDNGWAGTDRGHGHGIYTHNKDGTKTIADCILTGGYGFTVHAYGSRNAYVDHFLAEGNIVYNGNMFLIGGGRPSHDIRILNNYLYGVPMRIGYSAPENEDCEIRDNVIVNGGLDIVKYKKVVKEDNLVLDRDARRPKGVRVILRPNKYDAGRAHLAVYNWQQQAAVQVTGAPFLKPGDRYRLMDPRDVFGKPVLSGTYDGKPIRLPMVGEFAAYVVLRESAK